MKGKLLISFLLFVLMVGVVFAAPIGTSPTTAESTRQTTGNPSAVATQAGNVTEFNDMDGYRPTEAWAAFTGNLTGVVQLADGNSNVFYNWSGAATSGEVYASNDSSVAFLNMQCFNLTATGTHDQCADATLGGTTSLCGMNSSTLEHTHGILNMEYGAATEDVDGVNETFSTSNTHGAFATAGNSFSAGECAAAYAFNATGGSQSGDWEQVLLWDPDQNATVFSTIIEDGAQGFDNGTHDFEMMVLEDGHGEGATVVTTNYYFWVEIS